MNSSFEKHDFFEDPSLSIYNGNARSSLAFSSSVAASSGPAPYEGQKPSEAGYSRGSVQFQHRSNSSFGLGVVAPTWSEGVDVEMEGRPQRSHLEAYLLAHAPVNPALHMNISPAASPPSKDQLALEQQLLLKGRISSAPSDPEAAGPSPAVDDAADAAQQPQDYKQFRQWQQRQQQPGTYNNASYSAYLALTTGRGANAGRASAMSASRTIDAVGSRSSEPTGLGTCNSPGPTQAPAPLSSASLQRSPSDGPAQDGASSVAASATAVQRLYVGSRPDPPRAPSRRRVKRLKLADMAASLQSYSQAVREYHNTEWIPRNSAAAKQLLAKEGDDIAGAGALQKDIGLHDSNFISPEQRATEDFIIRHLHRRAVLLHTAPAVLAASVAAHLGAAPSHTPSDAKALEGELTRITDYLNDEAFVPPAERELLEGRQRQERRLWYGRRIAEGFFTPSGVPHYNRFMYDASAAGGLCHPVVRTSSSASAMARGDVSTQPPRPSRPPSATPAIDGHNRVLSGEWTVKDGASGRTNAGTKEVGPSATEAAEATGAKGTANSPMTSKEPLKDAVPPDAKANNSSRKSDAQSRPSRAASSSRTRDIVLMPRKGPAATQSSITAVDYCFAERLEAAERAPFGPAAIAKLKLQHSEAGRGPGEAQGGDSEEDTDEINADIKRKLGHFKSPFVRGKILHKYSKKYKQELLTPGEITSIVRTSIISGNADNSSAGTRGAAGSNANLNDLTNLLNNIKARRQGRTGAPSKQAAPNTSFSLTNLSCIAPTNDTLRFASPDETLGALKEANDTRIGRANRGLVSFAAPSHDHESNRDTADRIRGSSCLMPKDGLKGNHLKRKLKQSQKLAIDIAQAKFKLVPNPDDIKKRTKYYFDFDSYKKKSRRSFGSSDFKKFQLQSSLDDSGLSHMEALQVGRDVHPPLEVMDYSFFDFRSLYQLLQHPPRNAPWPLIRQYAKREKERLERRNEEVRRQREAFEAAQIPIAALVFGGTTSVASMRCAAACSPTSGEARGAPGEPHSPILRTNSAISLAESSSSFHSDGIAESLSGSQRRRRSSGRAQKGSQRGGRVRRSLSQADDYTGSDDQGAGRERRRRSLVSVSALGETYAFVEGGEDDDNDAAEDPLDAEASLANRQRGVKGGGSRFHSRDRETAIEIALLAEPAAKKYRIHPIARHLLNRGLTPSLVARRIPAATVRAMIRRGMVRGGPKQLPLQGDHIESAAPPSASNAPASKSVGAEQSARFTVDAMIDLQAFSGVAILNLSNNQLGLATQGAPYNTLTEEGTRRRVPTPDEQLVEQGRLTDPGGLHFAGVFLAQRIPCLASITILDLSFNMLEWLPVRLLHWDLSGLRTLMFHGNRLASFLSLTALALGVTLPTEVLQLSRQDPPPLESGLNSMVPGADIGAQTEAVGPSGTPTTKAIAAHEAALAQYRHGLAAAARKYLGAAAPPDQNSNRNQQWEYMVAQSRSGASLCPASARGSYGLAAHDNTALLTGVTVDAAIALLSTPSVQPFHFMAPPISHGGIYLPLEQSERTWVLGEGAPEASASLARHRLVVENPAYARMSGQNNDPKGPQQPPPRWEGPRAWAIAYRTPLQKRLRSLTLHGNPLPERAGNLYRCKVLQLFPALTSLDASSVTRSERAML